MTEHDDEPACAMCGLQESDCICSPRDPTPEELEDAREQRLVRAERVGGDLP